MRRTHAVTHTKLWLRLRQTDSQVKLWTVEGCSDAENSDGIVIDPSAAVQIKGPEPSHMKIYHNVNLTGDALVVHACMHTYILLVVSPPAAVWTPRTGQTVQARQERIGSYYCYCRIHVYRLRTLRM